MRMVCPVLAGKANYSLRRQQGKEPLPIATGSGRDCLQERWVEEDTHRSVVGLEGNPVVHLPLTESGTFLQSGAGVDTVAEEGDQHC